MICGSGGSKSRLAKAAGAEPAGQMRDDNCTPLWRKAHLQVKMYKTPGSRSTFWKLGCQKSARRCGAKHISKSKCAKHTTFGPLLEVEMSKKCAPLWREAHFQVKCTNWVVRSVGPPAYAIFDTKSNVQNTPFSDHFWKLRCRKSARCCGAKRISKSKCTKHTIVGPPLEVEMSKKCTPLWREAHFEVKMLKTPGVRTTFGGSDVEKVRAVVARSTFRSQHVKNTTRSDHFWRFRCRKSACRCGAKPLLEVEMSKKWTPLWREAHFEVKMLKAPGSRSTWKLGCRKSERHCGAKHISKSRGTKHTTFGPLLEVEMSKKCTPLWRGSTFRSQNVQNTRGSDHFWRFRCRFASLHYATLHYTTLHYTPLHYITLHYTPQHYNYNYTTTLHYTPLHSIALHYTKFCYTTLHCITLHYTQLHYTTLHYTTLHYLPLHFTTLHSTTLHSTTTTTTTTQLHSTTLRYTTLHYTTPHYTTLRYLPLHFTTLHYTPLHYNYNYTTTLHYTPLHYTTLHYTTLHYTTLPSTTLHYITLHYTPLHFTTLLYTTPHYNYNYNYTTTLHYTPLHSTTLHYTQLHYTTLHYTTLHSTTLQLQLQLHYTTPHYTKLHYTTLHYIPLHSTTLHYIALQYTLH